jgi:hypothetical protein
MYAFECEECDLIIVQHQYNNCTTTLYMRWIPVCETHPHVKDYCTIVY